VDTHAEPNPEGFTPPPLFSIFFGGLSAKQGKRIFKVENERRLYASTQGALDKDFI
jgi:hypothetical protein